MMFAAKQCITLVLLLLLLASASIMMIAASSFRDQDSSLPRLLSDKRHLEETCIANLEAVSSSSTEGAVTAQEFLDFLSIESNGTLEFSSFSQVPLDLRLLFYATACSGGQDCTQAPPTIDLNASDGLAATLLQIFCARVETILQEQQQEPQSLKISFQYNLYYQTSLTTEEIMNRAEGSTIIDRLEVATERIVRNALGCNAVDDSARQLRSDDASIQHVMYSTEYHRLLYEDIMTSEEQEYCMRHDDLTRQLQDEDCEYTVTAVVEDLRPYDCDPPAPSDDIQCAIVSSSVSISGEFSEEERVELRAIVISFMLDSINDGSFEEYLP